MAKSKTTSKAPSNSYKLFNNGIKNNPLYKQKDSSSTKNKAYELITEKCDHIKKSVPGQLVIFEYDSPIHKEELEYYDALPCVIMFNNVNFNGQKRVLGFNIHYYPPKMRYMIMNGIFNMFKPFFLDNWEEGSDKTNSKFNYNTIIKQLKRYDLDFGVRMYDPKLIKSMYHIPPKHFSDAVFTEGAFQKKTQSYIYKYWSEWIKRNKK